MCPNSPACDLTFQLVCRCMFMLYIFFTSSSVFPFIVLVLHFSFFPGNKCTFPYWMASFGVSRFLRCAFFPPSSGIVSSNPSSVNFGSKLSSQLIAFIIFLYLIRVCHMKMCIRSTNTSLRNIYFHKAKTPSSSVVFSRRTPRSF